MNSTIHSNEQSCLSECQAALDGLRAALNQPLDCDDLGRLAQMHSHCQALAGTDGNASADARELATSAVELLEKIILKEAEDAQASLNKLEVFVRALTDVVGAPSAATSPTPATPTPAAAAPSPAPAPTPAAPPTGQAPQVEEYVSEPLLLASDQIEDLQGFLDESREHLDGIEVALLGVETDPDNADKINELFRPFHTIKGIAGFLNLRDINRLTHEIETILDKGRRHEMQITPDIINVIFRALDFLKQQLQSIQARLTTPADGPVPQPDIRAIMRELRQVAATRQGPASGGSSAAARPDTAPGAAAAGPEADPATEAAKQSQLTETSIRVDTVRLDSLVDAVGELVIAQTMVNLSEVVRGDEKLGRAVTQVTKIVRDIQETAMALRMVPIGATFNKMRRVVRDVSQKAGKKAELVISGEDTELDKNVSQSISDPLVHMVRNSVDHGIEPPDERVRLGKPECGSVQLDAFYQGDNIVIEIRDDGRGLDPRKLVAKAVERGMIAPDQQLADEEAFNLIMAPGFSTAKEVTDISGRGVGMDVVRRNVEQLRGKIRIASELGKGTTISIILPLTLAIIDGMLLRIGGERVIIPTIMIEKSLRSQAGQITRVQQQGEMLQVRGELIPIVQIGKLFGYSAAIDPGDALLVIALAGKQKIGIVCDELIGQQQVVIKSLSQQFKQIRGVSGAAILGDGRVGLILEPVGLLALHNEIGGGWSPAAGRRRHTDELISTAQQAAGQAPANELANV